MDKRDYLYVYSEITGYGLTTLLFLDNIYHNDLYIKRAILAYKWIINYALHISGGILSRKFFKDENANDNYSFEKSVIFTFDTSMVLFGLAGLYKKTGEKKILKICKNIADFLLKMENPKGGMYAFFDPHTLEKGDNDDKWSNQTGAFHAKCGMGLVKLYNISKNKKYLEYAEALCDHALKYQESDGRFITHRKESATLQHPHCYAAEGLLYCGKKLKRNDYVKASENAVKWSLSTQLKNGGIPQKYHPDKGFIHYERTDIIGQILRLGCFYNKEGIKLKKLYNRLLEFQETVGAQKGGIYYGTEADGTEFRDLNSWCSMFTLQAIWFYKKNYKITVDYII